MYGTFYGLNSPPFSPRPDIRFLYLDENRHRVLEMVEYAVRESAGFCVISGKAGIGKTILVHALIRRLGEQVHAGMATCAPGSARRFTDLIATAFHIDMANASTSEMYRRIKNYIADLSRTGKRALLVIDNAHHLKPGIFKLLVHLVSVDGTLRVVLVGHPELRRKFSRPAFGESAPNVIIQTSLSEFNMIETDAYIRHRLVVAGGAANLFSQSASKTVYRFSRGVPGLINCACNYALEAGYEGKHRVIDKSIVSDLLKERHDIDSLNITETKQKPKAVAGAAEHAGGVTPGLTTGPPGEQDLPVLIRESLQNHYRSNRRLVYAGLAGILLPATVVAWLFFQSRPGEQPDPAVETQIANSTQPAAARSVNEEPREAGSGPPSRASRPAGGQATETTEKRAQTDLLDDLKAVPREREERLAEQHAEQARSGEATRRERERIVEIGSLPGKLFKPETGPEIRAEAPGAQNATAYTAAAANERLAENETLAMIKALKEQQHALERRIAVQRSEYNLIKQEIQIESDRIAKAKALIKRAYKSARFLWNQVYKATPEAFPEDPEQP